jgi:hypothetical protein
MFLKLNEHLSIADQCLYEYLVINSINPTRSLAAWNSKYVLWKVFQQYTRRIMVGLFNMRLQNNKMPHEWNILIKALGHLISVSFMAIEISDSNFL